MTPGKSTPKYAADDSIALDYIDRFLNRIKLQESLGIDKLSAQCIIDYNIELPLTVGTSNPDTIVQYLHDTYPEYFI